MEVKNDKAQEIDSQKVGRETTENVRSGCRICGCTSFVQRSGGGIVCGRESCRHGKGDHGPI